MKARLAQIDAHCARLAAAPETGLPQWPQTDDDARALAALYLPKEFGGEGLGFGDVVRVFQTLGRHDPEYALGWSVHNAGCYAICKNAGPALLKRWGSDLITGRRLAGFALTEPQSGSDPVSMETRARRNADGSYTVTGRKAWVSLAGTAAIYPTVVKLSDEPGHHDMAMLAIPADTAGVSFSDPYDIPGMRRLPVADMALDAVTVPADHLLLPEGKGLAGALFGIDIARLCVAAASCGIISAVLDKAIAYTKARNIGGAPSLSLDAIQRLLGDVATDLELAELLTLRAASALGGPDGPRLVAMAKLFAPEAALKAVTAATQAMGGAGLLAGSGLEPMLRMAQVFRIVDGTSEIQRKIIGRSLTRRGAAMGPPSKP